MADLSKLILLTTVNTFKAENAVQTGSFVLGGAVPELASSGLIVRTFSTTIAVAADYYDITISGPMMVNQDYPTPSIVTGRYANPGRAMYRAILNSAGYSNYALIFQVFASLSGNVLTFTVVSQNQFVDSGGSIDTNTYYYRIIPYSATTQ